MAAQGKGLLPFFTEIENQGGIIVRETPRLDLELYIANYGARSRFDRLLLIGRSSVPLCIEALKAAIVEAKKGSDIQRYRDAWECIRVAAPEEPESIWDDAWVTNTQKSNVAETHRLETELKGYKNNLVKESIRIGHRDLGEHLERIGDFNAASDTYLKMRPEASTQYHITDLGKHVISVMFQKKDWPSVLSNITKIVASNLSDEDSKNLQPYTKMVTGVAQLGCDRYYDAARSFLDVGEPSICQQYNDIASPNDVTIYGGLLALASMDRQELQARVLDNSGFRNYLELEPHIRKAVSMFVNGRYSACLAILETGRTDYLLDIYLQRHVTTIYSMIRSKCIVQYFLPFSCVTLESLHSAFARPGESLQKELVTMIRSGTLKARINTIDKLLVAVSTDPRVAMQNKALETARNYEKEAVERIRRMSLAAADLQVKGTSRKAQGPNRGDPTSVDQWLDDSRRPASHMDDSLI
ncbi:COP9 signalosome complex subunit 1 [Microdochium nivale]|nr:COP9 signalosome complex subunit 1 [Microdochium nivale]